MAERTANTGEIMSNDYDYHLVVLGNPKAQGRPKGKVISGHVHIYDPSESRKAKKSLALIVQEYAPAKLLICPLAIKMEFYFPYRQGDYGTGRNAGVLKTSVPLWHTVKPDVDNCVKLALDAMTGIFFHSDSIISKLEVIKQYSERPRTEIFIKVLKNNKEI